MISNSLRHDVATCDSGAAATPSTTDVPDQPAPPTVNDQAEDPLLSSDMEIVNQELQRRGFSPDIYFDYDESTLSDDTRDKLSRNADLLKSNPQFSITIEGHADSRGTNEYNLSLGDRRANAVRDYLVSLGVAGNRMMAVTRGEESPQCTEETDACWQRNRRGHFVFTAK